jgi:gelsolin
MLKARKFNINDSNIALLGSDIDKKIKAAAADGEEAWKDAGKEVGIQIWRIEKFKVVPWPKDQFGHFYTGDSYILLRTYKAAPEAKKLSYDVHFWIGRQSTQDEYGTAAYKTVELDDYLKGDPVQHREIQGYESQLFLSYFKTIVFHEGGVESGFRKVGPKEFKPRLLHLKGARNIVVREVPIAVSSMNSGDVFILDAGLDIYQLNGKESGAMERAKAAELSRALDGEQRGLAEVHVLSEDDTDEYAIKFWEYFGGKQQIGEAIPDTPAKVEKKLFRLSDETGKMQMVAMKQCSRDQLDSNDAFILDAGYEVFVWIGKGASKEERSKGLAHATDYLFKNNRPRTLPISRVIEGGENDAFNAALG